MTIELKRPPRVIRTTPALTLLPPTTWPAPGQWTYEDYARLPDDGNRYEVIKGVLYMTPSPTTLGAWGQGEVAASAVLPGWRVAVDEIFAPLA